MHRFTAKQFVITQMISKLISLTTLFIY